MNEIKLSDDLTTIETEIKSYQNIAGQSIFEIGRRLKHVKENDLAHGEFGKWLESVNLNQSTANKMMKVSSELNSYTYTNLGLNALEMIATLPETERTNEHTTSKGEIKTPDEMTVKELRELKKQLKQREQEKDEMQSQLEMARKSEQTAIKQLEDEQNKLPETKTEYKEVIPDNIKKKLEQIENNKKLLEQKDKENRDIRKQLREQQEKLQKQQGTSNKEEYWDVLTDDQIISRQRVYAETNVLEIKEHTDEFLNKVSVNTFRDAAIAKSSQRTKNMIYESTEEVIAWAKSIQQKLNSNSFAEDASYREDV